VRVPSGFQRTTHLRLILDNRPEEFLAPQQGHSAAGRSVTSRTAVMRSARSPIRTSVDPHLATRKLPSLQSNRCLIVGPLVPRGWLRRRWRAFPERRVEDFSADELIPGVTQHLKQLVIHHQ